MGLRVSTTIMKVIAMSCKCEERAEKLVAWLSNNTWVYIFTVPIMLIAGYAFAAWIDSLG